MLRNQNAAGGGNAVPHSLHESLSSDSYTYSASSAEENMPAVVQTQNVTSMSKAKAVPVTTTVTTAPLNVTTAPTTTTTTVQPAGVVVSSSTSTPPPVTVTTTQSQPPVMYTAPPTTTVVTSTAIAPAMPMQEVAMQPQPPPSRMKMPFLSSAAATLVGQRQGCRNRHAQRVMIYVFVVFSFIRLLFDILASALSQLDQVGGGCYTYWGFKEVCTSTSYSIRTDIMYECRTFRAYLRAGAAMSILGILMAAVTFVLAWILCCRMRTMTRLERRRMYCCANVDALVEQQHCASPEHDLPPFQFSVLYISIVLSSLIASIFELIAWALIAGAFGRRLCEVREVQRTKTYGVGFGLGLTSWILGIIFIVAFIVFA